MKPTMDDVQVVLNRFDASDWDELRIDHEDFHLHVYKTPGERRPSASPVATLSTDGRSPTAATTEALAPAATPTPTAAEVPVSDASASNQTMATGAGLVEVTAPTLGTFYRAPKPGAAAFVEVGQVVNPTTELCILEVMKLFTSVQAGVNGVVREVMVADGELVEHNQVLFVIEPADA